MPKGAKPLDDLVGLKDSASKVAMIRLGRVKGNKMVDMQLSNNKLVDRGTKMVQDALKIGYDEAALLLEKHGSVRAAVENYRRD